MYEELTKWSLLNLNETIASDIFDEIVYPWEVLGKIHDFILKLGETLSDEEYVREDNIWIAKSAKIAHTAEIIGPAIIGKNSEIRQCAYIRGNVIIGENAVVGNSTEIKNVILFNNVQVPHYNYIGDSILGYKAHFGAGALTSNVKSDKTNVTIQYKDIKIETGLKKMGAIVGDNVEIGCNSVLNPGTIIGKETNVYPLSMVRGFVPRYSIFKKQGDIQVKK